MLARALLPLLRNHLESTNKILVLYGPRQVGKTTLVREALSGLAGRHLSINAEDQQFNEVLSSRDTRLLHQLVAGYDLLFIDEAQRIPDIGLNLKILHDSLPALKIVVTGSSSFELANRTQEPLTGRTRTYTLYPVATTELQAGHNPFELRQLLPDQLLFGGYPELLRLPNPLDKREYLHELSTAYLYRDILELTQLRYPDKLRKLLQLLALQIGSPVSLSEVGSQLQMSKETVANYLDLLEKAFVVFRLSGFSRNLRKEVVKMDKVYFYDLGIRNALLNSFAPLDRRTDTGGLWENFLMVERRKRNAYARHQANTYYWRTYTGAELDYVEESDGQLNGFEFKLSRKAPKPPASWLATYPGATYADVNRDNYLDFVL